MKKRYLNGSQGSQKSAIASDSERSLAAAVLKQAWCEAIIDLFLTKETVRDSHSLLKKEAVNWIKGGSDGFVYWCQLAEVDHLRIQERLNEVLRSQSYPR